MKKKKNIRIFQSVNDLAKFALEWLTVKMEKTPEEKLFTVALSGGTTPKQLFQYIALHGQQSIDWKRMLFFWSDERCVLPDSTDSNYRMARLCFLDKLDIPEKHIFRIHGEAAPAQESQRYSRILSEKILSQNGLPRFDLILLGLGEDGHTASIFPGNIQLFQSDRLCEVVKHPQTGQLRITLTGPVINNAAEVAFLVTGSGKAEIVSKVLNKGKTDDPASLVCPNDGRLTWLLDKDAAPDFIHWSL
ncbi:MAG: 6-phosphogluconolactonase [Bacteroidales bacterium]|nr:6-phosphogluconolactonase [Bacteroidales bacterium]